MKSMYALLTALALVCACSGDFTDNRSDDRNGQDGAGNVTDNTEVTWTDCPAEWPEFARESARCAQFDVPARWDDPEGARISAGVIKLAAGDGPATGQLWLLDGGPGGTGFRFLDPNLLALFAPTGMDVYIPIHRGTLHPSTELQCSSLDNRACAAELVAQNDLALLTSFSTMEAGRDVGFLIDQIRGDDTPVWVFGGSYGTHWLLRYLRFFPDQATGAIFDGTLYLSDELPFARTLVDNAASRLLAECADDSACRDALGDDPMSTVAAILDALDDGTCPAPLSRGELSLLLGDLLGHSYAGARLMLGVLSRLSRCQAQDLGELAHFIDNSGALLGFPFPLPADTDFALMHNQAVNVAVVGNELAAPFTPFPASAVAERESQRLILGGSGTSPEGLQELADIWPRIALADDFLALPETSIPMLFLNGGLDLNAPLEWAETVAEHYAGPTTVTATFPQVGHIVLYQTVSQFQSTCAVEILGEFVAAPGTAPDLSCIDTMQPFDLAATTQSTRDLATAAFGTDDLYGSPAASGEPSRQ